MSLARFGGSGRPSAVGCGGCSTSGRRRRGHQLDDPVGRDLAHRHHDQSDTASPQSFIERRVRRVMLAIDAPIGLADSRGHGHDLGHRHGIGLGLGASYSLGQGDDTTLQADVPPLSKSLAKIELGSANTTVANPTFSFSLSLVNDGK